ncbi:protein of unknown function [Hyphomicrobium sp. 1Nfss2.1]
MQAHGSGRSKVRTANPQYSHAIPTIRCRSPAAGADRRAVALNPGNRRSVPLTEHPRARIYSASLAAAEAAFLVSSDASLHEEWANDVRILGSLGIHPQGCCSDDGPLCGRHGHVRAPEPRLRTGRRRLAHHAGWRALPRLWLGRRRQRARPRTPASGRSVDRAGRQALAHL